MPSKSPTKPKPATDKTAYDKGRDKGGDIGGGQGKGEGAKKAKWIAEVATATSAIASDDWHRCVGDGNPLLSYAFFSALETSDSVAANAGWWARPIVLKEVLGGGGEDIVRGIVPFYIKSHSWGEYVFDQAWADAWRQSGGEGIRPYYPKAQVAIPFTPVPSPRLLIDTTLATDKKAEAHTALANALIHITHSLGLSSVHITFADKAEYDRLISMPLPAELAQVLHEADKSAGWHGGAWSGRLGTQFHWHNHGYGRFDDFMATLTARRRKMIKRERRDVAAAGIRFQHLTGDDLRPQHWDDFYRFYLAVIDRKWGGAYLTRQFFDHIHQSMPRDILLVMAYQENEAVAAALNFIGSDTLYGRNWGSVVDVPFLHFETCYYQAIDFAIARGLGRVEAGAQGLHKVQRGYQPALTYSLHHMCHPQFHASVADFNRQEARLIAAEHETLANHSPYNARTKSSL